MDDSGATIIADNGHLQRLTRGRRTNEHGHGRVVGNDVSSEVSHRVQHVFVSDTVLAGTRLNVHPMTLVEIRRFTIISLYYMLFSRPMAAFGAEIEGDLDGAADSGFGSVRQGVAVTVEWIGR